MTVHFQIYCHEDCKCSLKVVGERELRECDSILAAIEEAQKLSETGQCAVTVYSTFGTEIFETTV